MTNDELKKRVKEFKRFNASAAYATYNCIQNPCPTLEKLMNEARIAMFAVACAICDQLDKDLKEEEQNEMANQQPKKTEGAE